ncbi:hypothetical protein RUM43_001310 [Polyplax serrata]|uniref:Uncharacterized protein n=1 Tax=Polyplax serrata TaxID=468196 RepID=A0AAN8SF59_POLSC
MQCDFHIQSTVTQDQLYGLHRITTAQPKFQYQVQHGGTPPPRVLPHIDPVEVRRDRTTVQPLTRTPPPPREMYKRSTDPDIQPQLVYVPVSDRSFKSSLPSA